MRLAWDGSIAQNVCICFGWTWGN